VSVINGVNKTDDNQESNGSGKSAIFSAMEVALFNTTQREGVTVKDLVQWGSKSAYISLSIYCPARQEELLIERTIGKNAKLDILINSEQADYSTTDDGNNLIIRWLGISRDDFLNYYLVGKKKYNSFYTSSNKVKLDMISRFSNLSVLDPSDDVVSGMIDKKLSMVNDLSTNISKNGGRVEQIKSQIEYENSRDFTSERDNKISTIKSRIDRLNEVIDVYESNIEINNDVISNSVAGIEKEKSKIITLTEELSKIDIPDFNSLISEIDNKCSTIDLNTNLKSEELNETKDSLNNLLSDIRTAEMNVKGSITCPKCSHVFNPSIDKDISSEKKFIEDANGIVETIGNSITALQESITAQKFKYSELQSEKSEIYNSINLANKKVSELSSTINDAKFAINTYNRTIERKKRNTELAYEDIKLKKQQIAEYNIEISNVVTDSIDTQKIAALEKEKQEVELLIEKDKEEVDNINDEIKKLNVWKYNLKIFRSELSTEVLDVITAYTNKELEAMKTDLLIKWDGFKILGNGNLSDKITPTVIRNGEKKKFGNFSGGERAKLEYASILANQYIINSTHPHNGLDFLMTDEITEGLDGLGLDMLIKALSNTNKTILLITHVVNRSLSCNRITVTKEFGVSTIKQAV